MLKPDKDSYAQVLRNKQLCGYHDTGVNVLSSAEESLVVEAEIRAELALANPKYAYVPKYKLKESQLLTEEEHSSLFVVS